VGSSANINQSVLPVKRYSTGYKMAQKVSRFVAGQLSPGKLHFALSVGRRPTGVQRDLGPQAFSEFNLFDLKLYIDSFGSDQLSRWHHY
jgi:hypothetical protein